MIYIIYAYIIIIIINVFDGLSFIVFYGVEVLEI